MASHSVDTKQYFTLVSTPDGVVSLAGDVREGGGGQGCAPIGAYLSQTPAFALVDLQRLPVGPQSVLPLRTYKGGQTQTVL